MNNKFKTLGLVKIPDHSFKYDLDLLGRFTEYSAELLRLSLIGISAIGYTVGKMVFPEKVENGTNVSFPDGLIVFLCLSLLLFCISAGSALLHRFKVTDSMSWHLQAIRRYERNEGSDTEIANKEIKKRFRRFVVSRQALIVSALTLGLATVAFVIAIFIIITFHK